MSNLLEILVLLVNTIFDHANQFLTSLSDVVFSRKPWDSIAVSENKNIWLQLHSKIIKKSFKRNLVNKKLSLPLWSIYSIKHVIND
jgi:hypothetical protein